MYQGKWSEIFGQKKLFLKVHTSELQGFGTKSLCQLVVTFAVACYKKHLEHI